MPDDQAGKLVRLTFRAERSDVPPWQRVKALLKYAGRHLGLRCTEAVEVTPPPAEAAPRQEHADSNKE